MPRETLSRLLALDVPVRGIHGNGELAVLAQIDAASPDQVTYWGTTAGVVLPEPYREWIRWTALQMHPDDVSVLRSWPRTLRIRIGDTDVLFCHGTPASETDVFTRLTPEDVLLPVFDGLGARLVVCGHTHMPFDRMIGATRVVNAGSVGSPFGGTGADWLLLHPEVRPRHTDYDLEAGAARIRATTFPGAQEFANVNVLSPPSEAVMLESFTRLSF
jgi:diadenosine tetraphosphatase ApaH/serine/threonine PP2A family protein phosphatase